MKEYWVNVLRNEYLISLNNKLKHKDKEAASFNAFMNGTKVKYRLHVREFETREAKELYLKMKYGIRGRDFDLKPALRNYGGKPRTLMINAALKEE